MIRHAWSLICKESRVNPEDNSLSIHDVLEQIQANAASDASTDLNVVEGLMLPVPFEVTTFLTRDSTTTDEQASLRVTQLDETGAEIARNEQEITIPAGMHSLRVRMKSSVLPVKLTSQTYQFKVELKPAAREHYDTVTSLPLEVRLSLTEE